MEKKDNGALREVKRTVIGLAVAFGIVGLVAVAVFYFFPGFLGSSDRDWSSVEDDSVEIYYRREDLSELDPESYLSRVIRAKEKIAGRLNIEEREVPDRIRVYLHENPGALRAAIAERKSSPEADVPLAVMDLIYGFELEPVLVRLLTSFSWGRPSSEFIRLGLQTWFSDRFDDPHLRVAALGEDLFSFSDINSLAATNNIPLTFHDRIYDSFDSPYAPAGMSLSGFSYLMRSETGKSPYRYEVEVEAASFVSYLMDKYGVGKFRSLWESNRWLEGVKEIYGINPEVLEDEWRKFVTKRKGDDSEYAFYRARTLYSRGRLAEAINLLDDMPEGESETRESLFLRARINFYSGRWEGARRYFSKLNKREFNPNINARIKAYLEMLEVYEIGEKREGRGLTLFGSRKTTDMDIITRECSNVVQKAKKEIPQLAEKLGGFRVFIDKGEYDGGVRDGLDLPNGVAFGSGPGDSSLKVAELIASGMSRTPTYSTLLRRGLVHFLTGSDVFQSAEEIVGGGRWESLSGITVDLDTETSSSVQAGAFVCFIISRYGSGKFTRVWHLTTPLGGDVSLETALREVVGRNLGEIEDDLVGFLKSYEGSMG
jgi:tetratricopeptide (TPR) repeat protein